MQITCLLKSILQQKNYPLSPGEWIFWCCTASYGWHLFDSEVCLHCWFNFEFFAESIIHYISCFKWCQYYCYSFFPFFPPYSPAVTKFFSDLWKFLLLKLWRNRVNVLLIFWEMCASLNFIYVRTYCNEGQKL